MFKDECVNFNRTSKILSLALAINCLSACIEKESSKSDPTNNEIVDDAKCQSSNTLKASSPQHLNTEMKDAPLPPEDFYLASEEIFYLNEQTYYFSNLYVESGALLTLSESAMGGSGKITVNAYGNCEFYGGIDLADYQGILELNCYDAILSVTNINAPNADVFLSVEDFGEIELDGVYGYQDGQVSSDAGVVIGSTSIDLMAIPVTEVDGVFTVDISDLELHFTPIILPTVNVDFCPE